MKVQVSHLIKAGARVLVPKDMESKRRKRSRSWEIAGGHCQQKEPAVALKTMTGGASVFRNTRRVPDTQQSFPWVQGNICTDWDADVVYNSPKDG